MKKKVKVPNKFQAYMTYDQYLKKPDNNHISVTPKELSVDAIEKQITGIILGNIQIPKQIITKNKSPELELKIDDGSLWYTSI